jgi:hypothetical protein
MRTLTFFENMKRIHTEDWGTRAVVYLYRLEPITDRLKGGNSTVFVMKYDEPVDQDKILVDHGSGKYRAILNFRKPGQDTGDQVDSAIFEMLNTNFPPKVPPGEWVNDSRNKKWAWAAPLMPKTAAEQQQEQAQRPIDDTVEKFRLFRDIANDAKEQARADHPTPPTAPAAPATDPVMTGLAIAEKFMAMKADNPMVEIMKTMLEDRRQELAAERQRSDRLQTELRSKENAPGASGLGSLKGILAEAKELGLLPEGGLKGLWSSAQGALQNVARSRMSGTEEFLQPILVEVAQAAKPLLPMLVSRMLQPKPPQPGQIQQPPQPSALPFPAAPPQPGQPPAPAAAAPANGAPPAATEAPSAADFDQAQAFAFIKAFADPFVRWFKEDKGTGGDFAEWIFDAYGADWQGLKWLHMKSGVGSEPIVAMFRGSPFWPEIAAAELKFTEYVEQFVKWAPEAAQVVVDLDSGEQDETEAN